MGLNIIIKGPAASGKSTIAPKIAALLKKEGWQKVVVLDEGDGLQGKMREQVYAEPRTAVIQITQA